MEGKGRRGEGREGLLFPGGGGVVIVPATAAPAASTGEVVARCVKVKDVRVKRRVLKYIAVTSRIQKFKSYYKTTIPSSYGFDNWVDTMILRLYLLLKLKLRKYLHLYTYSLGSFNPFQ